DPLPAAGEPDMHPAHAGAGQEETGQPVADGRVGFGHGVIARSRRAWSNRGAPSVGVGHRWGRDEAGASRRCAGTCGAAGPAQAAVVSAAVAAPGQRAAGRRAAGGRSAVSSFMAIRQAQAWLAGERDARLAYDWRDLGAMAPCLPVALIAAEDQNFATHSGFDFEAIRQARERNARGGRLRGGSTISQQVAKNLFRWQGSGAASRWVRKGLEAWYTVLLELLWPKRRILEVYANVAEFGDGVYGAQAAARRFFGRDASA